MRRDGGLRLLAALWIAYGLAHFVFADETLRQVPPSFPAKHVIVAISGALELGFGVMLLVPRTRRAGAAGLLLLLAAYVPAIVYMFFHDVVPASWPEPLRVALRGWIFPHHLLLIGWAWQYARAGGEVATGAR